MPMNLGELSDLFTDKQVQQEVGDVIARVLKAIVLGDP